MSRPTVPPVSCRARSAGFTLTESAVVLATLAVLVGAAVPSFQAQRERRALEASAAMLETDLQFARSEAVARNESVRIDFAESLAGSCYVMHTGDAQGCRCDAAGSTACDTGVEELRTVRQPSEGGIRLRSNSRSVLFDAVKGTITPTATMQLISSRGSLHQVINIMGRVRTCSPGGVVPGYRAC
jgi:type IV fimbrial biogenesis protein FimT